MPQLPKPLSAPTKSYKPISPMLPCLRRVLFAKSTRLCSPD